MLTGKITEWDGSKLTVIADFDNIYLWEKFTPKEAEVRIIDSRKISGDQRKKIYAIINEIFLWSGHHPEELKIYFKYLLMSKLDYPYFSLSDCEKSIAKDFIEMLIEFCLIHGVPCQDTLLNFAPDIGKFLYLSLYHKSCIICQSKENIELHHAEDRVGIGRNRKEISHRGLRAQSLCGKHHQLVHQIGQKTFNEKFYVFGIPLDELLCRKYKLKY